MASLEADIMNKEELVPKRLRRTTHEQTRLGSCSRRLQGRVGEGAATSGDLIRVQEVFGGKEEEKPDFSKRRYQPELPIFHFDIHNSYPLVSLELKRGLK